MKLDTTAKLVKMEGNQEDYADLIGLEGRLYLDKNNNWFGTSGGGCLTLSRKKVTQKANLIRVSTHLGNVFYFTSVKGT